MNQATLKIVFKTFEYVILVGLSVISIILSWEALVKFQSKDTNFKQRLETVSRYPTVTICFKPTDNSYIYGRDFQFNMYDSVSSFLNDTEHKNNVLQEELNDEYGFEVKETFSAYFGKCFRIIPTKYVIKKSVDVVIAIKFKNIISESMMPSAEVYFTSKVNSIGIGRGYWYEGDKFREIVLPKYRKSFSVMEHEYNFLQEKSKCSAEESWYDCYARLAESLSFDGCPTKCLAHSIYYNKSEKIKFCKLNTEEWQCSNKVLQNLRMQL